MRRMKAARFFRTVNRINSVGILAILAVGTLALLVGLTAGAIDRMGRRPEPRGEAAAGGTGDDRVEYGLPVPIEGSPVTALPLVGVQHFGGSFASGSGEAAGTWTRNLLFHDAATGRMRWLRADDRAAVAAWEVLREGELADPWGPDVDGGRGAHGKGALIGIRFEIAEADTDGDGDISPRDRVQVGLSRADGDGYVAVLRDVDEVRGYSAPAGGRLAVFFRRGEEERVAELDLAARRLVREDRLPAR